MTGRLGLNKTNPAAGVLLAVCAAPDADHAEALSALEPNDWNTLTELAIRSRTAGLLGRSIEQCADLGGFGAEARTTIAGEAQLDAITALSQGAASIRVIETLRSNGLEAIALKGFSLAFGDYPDPALRPLRDIDLLLTAEGALKAQAVLLDHPSFKLRKGVAQYGLEYSHQLPEIEEIESGLVIELHHRINARGWDQERQLVDMLKREAKSLMLLGERVFVPSPHANFLHLVEHATLHHLFSNGPLVLSDLHYLASNHAIDWDLLGDEAKSLGLGRALGLIALLAKGSGATWVPCSWFTGTQVCPEMLDHACQAMFETRDQTEQIGMLGRVSEPFDERPMARRLAVRAMMPSSNQLSRLSGRSSGSLLRWMGYPAWLLEKGRRYFAVSRNQELAFVSRQRQRLKQWIRGGNYRL